jgi:peptide/nickel transport system permease protein
MWRYLLRRILHSLGVIFAAVAIVFAVGRLVGDPVRIVLGIEASEERVAEVRSQLNLDSPIPEQFGSYIWNAAQGNLGVSFWQDVPALSLVLERLPATFLLAGVAVLFAVPLGLVLGLIAASRPGSLIDRAVSVISLSAVSIVEFWIALVLILVVAVQLGILPTSGFRSWEYVILPALALAYKPMGRTAQMTRSSILEELSKPYVRALVARGIPQKRIIGVHALKNAALPIITVTGDDIAQLLTGAIVIEVVFGWPGIGSLMMQAFERRDLPLVEASVLVIVIVIVVMNLLIDLAYIALNPKIRL